MFNNLRKLLRVEQWYKNLLVFLLPLVIGINNINYDYLDLILAFAGFCIISSITYIINDWADREKDKLHPQKKERPLASGAISGRNAFLIGMILVLSFIAILTFMPIHYLLITSGYFILTNLYTFGLKQIPILDMILITTNFVLRISAGLPNKPSYEMMPYILIVIGSIIVFLTHKRRAEIKQLGEKAIQHKKVLKYYSRPILLSLRLIGFTISIVGLQFIYTQTKISIIQYGLLVLVLLTTSIRFSQKSRLVIKPHYLLADPIWALVLVANIGYVILS
jgi:4-hydroxybenzoate polyprenyltransferase